MANGTGTKVPTKAQVVDLLAGYGVEADPRASLRELTALLVDTQAARLAEAETRAAVAVDVAAEVAASAGATPHELEPAPAAVESSGELVAVPGDTRGLAQPDLPARNRWQEMKQIAAELAHSKLLKPALRMDGDRPRPLEDIAADAMLILLTGHDLGLPPSTALAEVQIIEGTPAISAKLQRALIRRAGHRLNGPDLVRDDQGRPIAAVIEGQRIEPGGRLGDRMTIEFTIRDAIAMGLCQADDTKPNGVRAESKYGKAKPWQSQTGAMLRARATSTLATLLFADVLAGVTYTPEELMPEYVWADSGPAATTAPQTPQDAGYEPMSDEERQTLNAANGALTGEQRAAVGARLAELAAAGELPPRSMLGAPHVARVLAVIAEVAASNPQPVGEVVDDAEIVEPDGGPAEAPDAIPSGIAGPSGSTPPAMTNAAGDDLCPTCGLPSSADNPACDQHPF